MNQDAIDLINSHALNMEKQVGIGQIGMYREGIVRGKVKVLSRETNNNWTTIEVKVVGDSNYLKVGEKFKLGKKADYDGYVGWILTPLAERN